MPLDATRHPGSHEAIPGTAAPELRRAARSAGLRYVTDEAPGITRRRAGSGFAYRDPDGHPLRDKAELARIRALAIPPAYRDVWICPQANGHLQATGRDERGRKQYRYHPGWREARDAAKYGHMLEFAACLPEIRKRVAADMARPGLPREKVLATVVRLLEETLIRVGNEDYAEQNGSYGLTTLRRRHVRLGGDEIRFDFKGKSGKRWQLGLRDRRIAKVIRACQDLPGQELFAYRDEAGEAHAIRSEDVNDYLRAITGRDITAKDFRTWAGTVMAALALREFERFDSQAAGRRNISAAIGQVARRLGNTPAVCRKCYIHPDLLEGYLAGRLALEIRESQEETGALHPEEVAVLALLTHLRSGRAA
ncbi:DNA topoisomerase IB [Roseomonas gilardii subsp. gilardii]|uniref:DNA topoisomerase IB n=1 Tax=Roseomonas gilardii TaxID=257708 RepID=UPI001FF89444|nr:DNA topoisomerase IB [Roseomonas gilardii]UPG71160.1 DNA topoisomerase IB [Roseomonas gilardii subsp. gilardii]